MTPNSSPLTSPLASPPSAPRSPAFTATSAQGLRRALLLTGLAMALTAASGCTVYTGDPHRTPVNYTPYITYADAGCYWDASSPSNPAGYDDYVWYFEADATDDDGAADVVQVYADVYDDYTGEWVDGFDLYPDVGVTWFSAWVGATTYLDCSWPGYVVDITAVDYAGASDIVTLYPTQSP